MGGLAEVDVVGVIETWMALVLEGSGVVDEVFFLSGAALADETTRRLKSQWIWMNILRFRKCLRIILRA